MADTGLSLIIQRQCMISLVFRQSFIFHARERMNRIAFFAYSQAPIFAFCRWQCLFYCSDNFGKWPFVMSERIAITEKDIMYTATALLYKGFDFLDIILRKRCTIYIL